MALSPRTQFVMGGALINLGFRLQDHIEDYDLDGPEELTPDDIFRRMLKQNQMASRVRDYFPRSARHPLVALVVCMDSRLDTTELVGDTRKYYYVIRTAGSVLREKEQDMLELAVQNGVRAVVFTTHSECAAEKVAHDAVAAARFPHLAEAVAERTDRAADFMRRPAIAQRIREGKLVVRFAHIHTGTARMEAQAIALPAD
ncbi:MAG: hypothetical protein RL385_4974 [Pseudomonadota bacterium]